MTALVAVWAGTLFGVNLFPVGDFESWNAERDQPAGEAWRWGFSQRGTNGFAVCERSVAEKHGGTSSLHLKDTLAGSLNHTLWYGFHGPEFTAMTGRVVRVSAWIKPVSASDPRFVGIALSATDRDGHTLYVKNGPGLKGPGDWMNVHVNLQMPPTLRSVRLTFNCSNGFGNTGEMYVDDVVVSTDPADHPSPTIVDPVARPEHAYTLPDPVDTPEEAAYREGWRNQPPAEEDNRVRPEIRNGTWYVNGRPEYYLGVWIYNRTYIDWNPGANPLGIDHFAYTTPPGKEVFDRMGFNSSQISAAHAQIGAAVRGFPLAQKKRNQHGWAQEADDIATYFRRFADMPLVLDFAFGYEGFYPREARAILDQCKSGATWHAFVPFCPHHPEGARYYRDYFLGGTRAALRNGCNVFLYELFNESAWNDMCRYEVVNFAWAMKEKYKTIAAANATWGTVFDHFADVAAQVDLKQFPGVWFDWCRYTAQSYCRLLEEGKKTIRSADRRSHIYFTEQASGTPPIHRGMDYRLIAETLDALAIEGGWQYGFKTVFNAKNDMEAVVATSGSRHFFNCDFYRALAREAKPVVNDEHYCTRLENGKRVPSKRTDYITSLWLEVMHGVSANFTYVWDKRHWEANTPERAYANVVKPSYKSSSLLNPYNVKPEDLCAFKMFQDELAPYKERILPCPRTKPATVAVFFSKATQIQRDSLPRYDTRGPAWSQAKDTAVSDWYVALLHANYPCKVVFEEDLAHLGPEVEALVFPDAQCVNPAVVEAAEAFRKRGGRVWACPTAFTHDEYFKPLAIPNAIPRMAKVADVIAALGQAGVTRYAVAEPTDDAARPLHAVDAQVIDRGDFKFVCVAAMGETAPRMVRLHLAHLQPTSGNVYVWNPVAHALVPSVTAETWSAAQLADGISFTLPPQERILFTLTTRDPRL